jgi:signal transduction histidine kinase
VQRGLSVARGHAEMERSSALAREIERVISSRAAEFRRPGLRLERSGLNDLSDLRVLGTPAELTFVFDNLLGNALRAVRGEAEAVIRVEAARSDGRVTVTFEDTGRGMASSEHERVFARGVSEKGGGHGLPRSREIVERRGGSVRLLRSAPGEGAVFAVTLKVVVQDE